MAHGKFHSRVASFWTLMSGLLIKSSRLDISELQNYFTKIKLITSRSKWTGPYNNERMKYNKIR